MNPLKYYHNVVTLPSDLEAKLDQLTDNGLFAKSEPHTAAPLVPDAFYPDGKPTVALPDFLYPCYAPFYLGTPFPSSLASVPEGYSRRATVAALAWLEKVLTNPRMNRSHFDAEMFTAILNGTEFRFAFPNTLIQYTEGGQNGNASSRERYAAVIAIADVSDNDTDWEDGTIPYYVECQARFLLWCWNVACDHLSTCPSDCFIVRITGNTPGDVLVRVVHSNPAKEVAMMNRIGKRMTGKDISAVKANMVDQGTWTERKDQERENAYVIDDPDIYALVRSYMETRTQRKTLEAKSAEIKEQMDAIAIRLSYLIEDDHRFGSVKDLSSMREYTVSHTPKATQAATVNPPLIRQFFPEHVEFIRTHEVPRGVVSIEAE